MCVCCYPNWFPIKTPCKHIVKRTCYFNLLHKIQISSVGFLFHFRHNIVLQLHSNGFSTRVSASIQMHINISIESIHNYSKLVVYIWTIISVRLEFKVYKSLWLGLNVDENKWTTFGKTINSLEVEVCEIRRLNAKVLPQKQNATHQNEMWETNSSIILKSRCTDARICS